MLENVQNKIIYLVSFPHPPKDPENTGLQQHLIIQQVDLLMGVTNTQILTFHGKKM